MAGFMEIVTGTDRWGGGRVQQLVDLRIAMDDQNKQNAAELQVRRLVAFYAAHTIGTLSSTPLRGREGLLLGEDCAENRSPAGGWSSS